MRYLLTLLAAASLLAPSSAQRFRYLDIELRGAVSVQMIDGQPRVVVAGTGAGARDFVRWISGSQVVVEIGIGPVWAYDSRSCAQGDLLAVYNSGGFIEAGFLMDQPQVWHRLPSARIPDNVYLHRSGGYTTYSLGMCKRWNGWGVIGIPTCGTVDVGCWGSGVPDLWAVVLDVQIP